ncbi:hypothetical protein F4779DRAFT_569069 [Xylariaceae sp. FL0662B]|nr:hypothetical protein F4779DRAFT_569069 [Xylariaceae sp. FL0662B]
MASNGMSEGQPQWPENAPTHSHAPVSEDDEYEWEYEYSNTETETFYVTLDLSKADFTARDTKAAPPQYGGFRGGQKAERSKLFLNRRTNASNIDANSVANSEAENEDGSPSEISKEKQPEAEKFPADDEDEHQVQILELHSENPIISYKGRVYSGLWSQNAGTELLMTKRDDENPLPALRHLEDDVELLAASCARITVQERELKPRHGVLKRQWNHGASADNDDVREAPIPPPDKAATRERVDQGNFLANFIALKKRKGETDEVTVIAKSRDRGRRNKRVGYYRRASRRGRAKQHVPEIHEYGPRDESMARGRDNGHLGEPARGVTSAVSPAVPFLETRLEPAGSMPTPSRWDDLEEEQEEERDTMMDDVIEEDGNGYEESSNDTSVSGSEEEGSADNMDVDEE